MSLLLDALRKSEKRRRADAPPLSLPSGPGPYRSGPRRRGTWILIMVVVLAAVAAGAAWIYLGPFSSDTGSRTATPEADEQQLVVPDYAAPVTNRPTRQGPSERRVPDPNREPASQPVEREQARSDPEPRARRSADAASEAGARTRAGSENDGEPEAGARPEAPVRTDSEAGTRSEAAVRGDRDRDNNGDNDRDNNGDNDRDNNGDNDRDNDRGRPEASDEPDQARSEPTSDDPTPARPAQQTSGGNSILPWELPTAARADFPNLDLTLHFYAGEPSNRFVLIGGERFVEGDRIAAGVVLAEITREGVVVDYRNYRVRLR